MIEKGKIPDNVYIGWSARFPVTPKEPKWDRSFCSGTPCKKKTLNKKFDLKIASMDILNSKNQKNMISIGTLKHIKGWSKPTRDPPKPNLELSLEWTSQTTYLKVHPPPTPPPKKKKKNQKNKKKERNYSINLNLTSIA